MPYVSLLFLGMVHFPFDWCVRSSNDETMCIKLQPWDCSADGGGCLSAYECCAFIQDKQYPKPDINGNELQCYEWELPVKSSGGDSSGSGGGGSGGSGGSSGGLVGNRLIIHVNNGEIALPSVITDGNHEVVHDEEIIEYKDCTGRMFSSRIVLYNAVRTYVNQGCATNPNCAIGQDKGWPINTWCLDEVTSFANLFKDLYMFNEDINGWTTSKVCLCEKFQSFA